MLITKANTIIILWQNVSSKDDISPLCVIHSWVDLEQYWKKYGCHGKKRQCIEYVLEFSQSVSFDINGPPFSVYIPLKNAVFIWDQFGWVFIKPFMRLWKLNLFDPFSWKIQLICYSYFCCGGGSRPLINLMKMWLWNLFENEWNMKSKPKKIVPAALLQNKIYN